MFLKFTYNKKDDKFMSKNKKYIIIFGLIIMLLLIFNLIKPYNDVESNLANIYYISYSYLMNDFGYITNPLNDYIQTSNKEYLSKAILYTSMAQNNITFFKLAQQSRFRNTIINQKVIKPHINNDDLERLYTETIQLQKFLKAYKEDLIKDKKLLIKAKVILENIYNGLDTKDGNMGYDAKTKEYKIALTNEQYKQLHENIIKLDELISCQQVK